jgi:hypothetical protein
MDQVKKQLTNPDGEIVEEVRLSESIFLYRNALSKKLTGDIYSFYYTNRNITSPGVTVGGHNGHIKKTFDICNIEEIPEGPLREQYQEIDQRVLESLRVVSGAYMDHFNWLKTAPNFVDSGYLWQMYEANSGFYKEHIDGECWSPHVANRVLAFVVYINDVEEGGETYFRHQDIYVKPERGAVAIFPTSWTHPHQAMVPKSNDKLIISSFLLAV